MNVPKVAYRNNIMLFSLPTCSGISYSTAKRFTVKPRASPFPNNISLLLSPGAERPSYATEPLPLGPTQPPTLCGVGNDYVPRDSGSTLRLGNQASSVLNDLRAANLFISTCMLSDLRK